MLKKDKSILVVDDDALIASQIQAYLEGKGYRVAGLAKSGKEAIEKARTLKPGLIFMDIMLGTGQMDGITAAEIIHRELEIPVIFVTAYGSGETVDRAKTADPAGFINKPFTEQELETAIELALYREDRRRELQTSEERYRSVVAFSVEAILIIDMQMRIVFWNQAASGMFGYAALEVEGKPFLRLIPETLHRGLSVELDRMVLTEEKNPVARTTETLGLRKDGYEFPMEFSISSWIIRDEIFFTVNARDITDRKKVEQMKTDFVSLVSHQLKTPVAGLLGCIDNLMSLIPGPLTKEQMEYLRMMKDISRRNYRNISDLLNVSRIERGIIDVDIKPVNLKKVAAAAVREHLARIREKRLALLLEGWREQITVLADASKLFEAMSNIVHNAVKFTDEGHIGLRIKAEDGMASVEIEDTGSGIPVELQGYVFKRDMILQGPPSPNRGTGLGLFISKEFMNLQKGELDLVSVPGEGSCFTFRVPLHQQPAE
ncbi:MAG TPA: response regulator [bacterium]